MDPPAGPPDLNDPVTRHVRRDYARLVLGQTVGQALDGLRREPPPGRIVYFYVVNADGRLEGVVPVRRLLLSPPDKPLEEITDRKVVALPAEATVLEACEFFLQHRFLALPVVDADKRLLGVVDVELYTDEISALQDAAGRDDLFQQIGVHAAQGQHDTPLRAFRRRFPWLGCNMAAGVLCALLAGAFKHVLDAELALAFFFPVVLNLAESVSSQSVSLALQALHGPRPGWAALVRRLRQELATGALLGVGSGAAIALVALVWLVWPGASRPGLALCLAGGIAGGVTGSAVLGLALPVLLRLFRLEPRVAAGPIALAGADVLTILLYLSLAHWLLG
jgi:magnesium transporter